MLCVYVCRCNVNITGTFLLHIPIYIIIYKIHSILYCRYIVQIHLYRGFYFIAHFLFFYLYLCILSCVLLHILHCPLSGPDLTYISLLNILCIIEYVTNKKTLETYTHSVTA